LWGVIHNESLPRGLTVNKECYVELTKRLRDPVRRKESLTCGGRKWLLHLTVLWLIRPFWLPISLHETTLVSQSPHSPALFQWTFPKLRYVLKGRVDSVEMKGNLLAEQRSIPKYAFLECFQSSNKRWERCMKSGVLYLERDKA
jgi:hypothetical protein